MKRERRTRFTVPADASPTAKTARVPALGLLLLLACAGLSACSEPADSPTSEALSQNETGAALPKTASAGSPPSIVLIVIESLRTDAVGSYGPDPSSPLPLAKNSATPHLDRLAEEGLRYAWSISASPNTVTSHASILSGLSPERHGASVWTELSADKDLTMVAEQLQGMGYETVGFAENPMVGPAYGLAQGFERFETPAARTLPARVRNGRSLGQGFDVLRRVQAWLDSRDTDRPYFLFVNLADPHLPLTFRPKNRFFAPGTTRAEIIRSLGQEPLQTQICRKLPSPASLRILGGLYLNEVEVADRKLGALVHLVRTAATEAARSRSTADPAEPIVIATADHGTPFGEDQLLGHAFSLHPRTLRVPLILNGGTKDRPIPHGVLQTPVAQWRVAHSIRCFAGDTQACQSALPESEEPDAEPIISVLSPPIRHQPPEAIADTGRLDGRANFATARCAGALTPQGRAVSWIEGNLKVEWREDAPTSLHPLGGTPRAPASATPSPSERAALVERLESFVGQWRLDQTHRAPPSGSLVERARATYDAARAVLLEHDANAVDVLWFAGLMREALPDPEVERWIEEQIPSQRNDPFFALVAPDEAPASSFPATPGNGIARWTTYLRASLAPSDEKARQYLDDYLEMETEGYFLTHQLSALLWNEERTAKRPDAARLRARFLSEIASEHAADPRFSDLWVERAALLSAFGEPGWATLETWTRTIVDHHLGNGDWGHTGSDLTFAGQTVTLSHPRAHIRGLALVVLAEYLAEANARAAN